MRPPIEFTPEELDYIRSNAHTLRLSEIADHLGVSVTTVRKRLVAMGLYETPRQARTYPITAHRQFCGWTKQEHELCVQLAADGLSEADIATILDRSLAAIHHHLLTHPPKR